MQLRAVLISILISCVSVVAIAIHAPGSLSTDSGLQVYEAATGRVMSWSPPFTSALLKWLGGGEIGTSLMVVLNVLFTYGSLGTIWVIFQRKGRGSVVTWRALAAAVLILNPIIFFYVGIIWKDVLFSAVLNFIVALTLVGSRSQLQIRVVAQVLALTACSTLPLIRQQGILVGPALAVFLSWFLASAITERPKKRIIFSSGFFLFYIGCGIIVNFLTADAISSQGSREYRTGFSETIKYDVAGTWQHSNHIISAPQDAEFPKENVAKSYTGERVDTLNLDSDIQNFFSQNPPNPAMWWGVVSQSPMAYIQHRIDVFGWLLGFHGVERCLPLIAGVSLPPYLIEATGILNRLDGRNQAVLQIAKVIEPLFIFQHWFYVAQLIITSIAVITLPSTPVRSALGAGLMVCWLHLLSFLPMGIACDFRYLYPIVPLLALIGIAILGIQPKANKEPS